MIDREIVNLQRRVDLLEQREPPLAAEFVTSATTTADDLLVIATGWDDGEHTFGPVKWHPIGGALPQAGDEAVIVERDDGYWTVVAWWSDSQGTGVAQSTIDALDARLDTLESHVVLFDEIAANETTANTSYTALGTVGPSITIPTSGDWLIAIGALTANNTAGTEAWMSYAIDATAASDNDAAKFSNIGTANKSIGVTRTRKKTLTAGAVLVAKYRVGGGTGAWEGRWMRADRIA